MAEMTVLDSIAFIVVGFAVVLGALVMLWGVSSLMGRIFVHAASVRAHPNQRVDTAPAPAASPLQDAIPPAHLVAIAAAVAELTNGRGRIVSVLAPAQVFTHWAREGRTEQFSSHRVRWDWTVPRPSQADNDSPHHPG